MSGFDSDVSRNVGGAFKKAAGLAAGALATAGIGSFFKGTIDAAANAEQSIGGVEAVFKNYANTVKTSAKEADQALGLSQNAYRELATLIGAQLKNAGTPMDQLSGKTNDLIKTGADLSAMFGGTTQDAVNALSSALKGEMDPIEKYGISLNDAALKAEAASLGLDVMGGSLSNAQRAQAVMSLVTKQSTDATGAFARENDTAANRAQRAAAQWDNLKTSIGDKLLPAWSGLMNFVGTTVLPGLSKVGEFAGKVTDGFKGVYDIIVNGDFTGTLSRAFGIEEDSPIVGVLFKIHDGFVVVRDFVRDHFQPIMAGLGAVLAVVIAPAILGAVGSLASLVGGALATAFGALLSPIALVALAVGGIVALFVQAYQDSEPLRDAVDKLKSAFSVFFDAFKAEEAEGGISGFFDRLKAGISAALPVVKEALAEMGAALWQWIQDNIGPALVKLGEFLGKIVDWIWNTGLPWLVGALVSLGQALIEWIGPRIGPALVAIADFLGKIVDWIWDEGIPWLVGALSDLGQKLIEWIGPRIPGILKEIAGFLGAVVTWIWNEGLPWLLDTLMSLGEKLLEWIMPRIPGIINQIGEFLGSVVGWIIFTGIPLLIGALLKLGYELITWVAPRIPGLIAEFLSLMSNVVKWIFTDGLPMLFNALWELGKGAVKGIWESMQDSPLFSKLGEILDGAVKIIGDTWDKIQEAVKKPIRLVFNFVNDNMIDPVNTILDKFPGKLSIPHLPQLASGGLLRGPGTGTSDSILGVDPKSGVPTAAVSNGEFVVKASQTRKHLGLLRAINDGVGQYADGGLVRRFGVKGHGLGDIVGGGLNAVGNLAGEVVDKAKDAVSSVKNFATDMLEKGARKAAELVLGPIRDAAVGLIPEKVPLTMLSGGINKLYDAVLGKGDEADKEQASLAGGTFGSSGKSTPNGVGGLGPAAAAARAFVQKTFGINNIGGYANRNIAGTGTKSDHALGKAIDVMIANYKSAGGIAQGNQVASYFVNNPGAFGTKYVIWRDQINSGSGWKPYGHPGGGRSDTLQHRDHVHVSLFDDGGVLPPGLTLAHNKSGKPEGILTNDQLGWLRDAASAPTQAAPLVGSLTFVVDERNGSVRDQMDEAMFQLRRIARGGANARR